LLLPPFAPAHSPFAQVCDRREQRQRLRSNCKQASQASQAYVVTGPSVFATQTWAKAPNCYATSVVLPLLTPLGRRPRFATLRSARPLFASQPLSAQAHLRPGLRSKNIRSNTFGASVCSFVANLGKPGPKAPVCSAYGGGTKYECECE
jgi:hypothetical protein